MWQVIPGQDLRQWGWDDEYVVYNNLSGDTHLLSGDAMQVLLALRAAPADAATLAASLQEPGTEADISAAVSEILSELDKLSLIEFHEC